MVDLVTLDESSTTLREEVAEGMEWLGVEGRLGTNGGRPGTSRSRIADPLLLILEVIGGGAKSVWVMQMATTTPSFLHRSAHSLPTLCSDIWRT